ncbi:MAG: phage shock protein [Tenuifilum sp.]|jgi:phage shock protein C|uniref:PspC domain-containing protein n=1 Tax=Tenuifilum sp. TaxID=2760880 RepID=UPI0024AAAF27|nr:PspC domain-containing protein [Tenuifilum sp.]MDI3526301.1 phage shock protein [Tenuifilum sp.]
MKKTISASLNRKAYILDEDAYEMLERYLSSLEYHFQSDENKTEILNDIETRIAEHFDNIIKVEGQVINTENVKNVIATIGTPSDIDSDDLNTSSVSQKAYPKLYRDLEERVLGGICSGMGHYWKVDPVLFRLVFVLLALWGGIGILIYLVLWIVIPPAKTPSERLEMKGEQFNINNIK